MRIFSINDNGVNALCIQQQAVVLCTLASLHVMSTDLARSGALNLSNDDFIYCDIVVAIMEGYYLGYLLLATMSLNETHYFTICNYCLLYVLTNTLLYKDKMFKGNVSDLPLLSSFSRYKITCCGSWYPDSKVIRTTNPNHISLISLLQVEMTASAAISVLSDLLGNIEEFVPW